MNKCYWCGRSMWLPRHLLMNCCTTIGGWFLTLGYWLDYPEGK